MKIIKIFSQQQFLFDIDDYSFKIPYSMDDFGETYSNTIRQIIDSYLTGSTTLDWEPVDVSRIKPLYAHFIKYNNVRDKMVFYMHKIIINLAENIARLQATTELFEHGTTSLEEMLEGAGYEEEMERILENKDRFYDYLESWDQVPISDYGLPKLIKILDELFSEPEPRKQISLMSQLFDVVHQRNDLAAFLIKGGSASLNELSEINS
jgi:hypothetical protein